MPNPQRKGIYRSPVVGFSVVVRRYNGVHEYCVKLHSNGRESWSSEWIEGHPRDQDVIPLVLATTTLAHGARMGALFGIPPENKL